MNRTLCVTVLMLMAAAVAPSAPASDRDALLHIVQDRCLPHWRDAHDPAPCASVQTPDYAVLADRKGGAHFLLIAARTVTGIEDPQLLQPDAPNYFAAAWRARDQLTAVTGHPLRRDAVGLAINSALARGQDQLHIHIECVQPRLYQALQAAAAHVTTQWAPLPVGQSPYIARSIRGQDLDAANPVQLLAHDVPGASQDMGGYTIIIAGMQFKDGPGFIVLAGRTPTNQALLLGQQPSGLVAPGESQLDSSCAVDP